MSNSSEREILRDRLSWIEKNICSDINIQFANILYISIVNSNDPKAIGEFIISTTDKIIGIKSNHLRKDAIIPKVDDTEMRYFDDAIKNFTTSGEVFSKHGPDRWGDIGTANEARVKGLIK